MAENIVELLTDVADAIREKKGSTEPINAQNFAEEIKNLPSGGDCDTIITAKPQVDNVFSWQELREIIVSEGVTTIGMNGFNYGYKLQTIKLPKSLTTISHGAFDNNNLLEALHIPTNVNNITLPFARNTRMLNRLSVDTDNTYYDSRNDCNAIIETATNTLILGCINTAIPESVTAIAAYAFQGNNVTQLVFPTSITAIGGGAFSSCGKLMVCDFRSATGVPILDNANAFSSIPSTCKIVVPDSLYEEWIAATNWNTLTKYIVKSSEYTD